MSKKRKTRKQKEVAKKRHLEQVREIKIENPVYSIIKPKNVINDQKNEENQEQAKISPEISFLRKDMMSIVGAAGIIVSFDILLFVLLSKGVLHLNIFGY